MKFLLIPIVIYLASVALMYVSQRSLFYLPGQRAGTAATLDAHGLRHWPDEAHYRGYLADVPAAEATIVVFHGNAGDAIDRLYYVEAFSFLNARLLLVEYPGYGARSGRPTETSLAADARETLALARRQFPDEPLHVIGESLGAAVASAAVGSATLTAAKPHVDGLLLLTPWDTLSALAAHHYRFLPVKWLLRDRYPSTRYLADLAAMKLVVVAEHDEVVPAAFGRALFDALPEPKALVVVVDAGHNDWFDRVDRAWWRERWEQLNVGR